jgi:hypothetical protein
VPEQAEESSSWDSRGRLQHFHLLCSVFGAKKEALAISGGNGLKGDLGGLEELLVGTRSVAAQDLFDLAPHLLNGIEVWRIGGQIQQPCAGGFDGLADSPNFVRGQIIQDRHVAGAQGGREPLPDPGQKHSAIHGTFKEPRSTRAVQAKAGDQGTSFVPSVGNARQQSLPAPRTAPQARHFGVGSAFVHKHQMGGGLGCDLNHRLAVFEPSFGGALFASPLNPLLAPAVWFWTIVWPKVQIFWGKRELKRSCICVMYVSIYAYIHERDT